MYMYCTRWWLGKSWLRLERKQSSMDDEENVATFSTALQLLQRLHSRGIGELQIMVESQNKQIQEKDIQLKLMKESVSKAKKKIQQQKNYISKLETQLGIPSTSLSESRQNDEQRLNKTAVSLFAESPLTSSSGRATDQSLDTSAANVSEQSLSGGGGIKIADVERLDYADSANESESTAISEEENDDVMIVYKTNLHGDETLGSDFSKKLMVDPPQTCVSLFEHSAKTSPRRPLRLNKASNRIKYKAAGNTSAESSSASNEDNLSATRKSPSLLSEPELLSPSLSESNSPPFLGSSPRKSPFTSPVTPCAHKEGMSVSIFQSTSRPKDEETKTPSTSAHIPIPLSDSQFSLDVSQSYPPSPELCTTALRGVNALKPRNLKRQLSDVRKEIVELSPKQRKVETTPGPHLADPTVITKTPSLPPTTMIPITPGISTVENILKKCPSYSKHNKNNRDSELPKSHHQDSEIDSEDVLPARRNKHSKHALQEIDNYTKEVKDDGPNQDNENFDHFEEDSPVLLYSTNPSGGASARGGAVTVRDEDDPNKRARLLAEQAGLPDYPHVTKILRKADRAKLDGKACPECEEWYDGCDGIHDGKQKHLRKTCRHKHLYPPPNTDPRMWDISFPNTVECEKLMNNDH